MSDQHSPEPPIHLYYCSVESLTTTQRAKEFERLLSSFHPFERIDILFPQRVVSLVSRTPIDVSRLKAFLLPHGFHLRSLEAVSQPPSPSIEQHATERTESCCVDLCIEGMTCRSCELTIERAWKKLPGVVQVDVDSGRGVARLTTTTTPPELPVLQHALEGHHYRILPSSEQPSSSRPSLGRLVALFAFLLLIGSLLSKVGLLQTSVTIGAGMSVGAIFLLGLVAASSSCVAVTGGLLLSSAARFNARYGSNRTIERMRPVFLFVGGRILSYTIFGGLLGVVGNALSPSPLVTAILTILAATYMLLMGLEMLQIAPSWLKRLLPSTSKRLSHQILDAERHQHPTAPVLLGAATFFLPCGFTQALQLYALTTGSFWVGATSLAAFALGTAPALLALGYASNSIKGKLGKLFFQFAGALVVILGIWNIQNGLAIAGVTFPTFGSPTSTTASPSASPVPSNGDVQEIRMRVSAYGYEPNQFTIRQGVPVKWIIDMPNPAGCASVLVSRKFGIQRVLERGTTVIEFTPTVSGQVPFSCSMGMFRGSFTVLPAT